MSDLSATPRLFVTGGTGFFGKALLRHWHKAGVDGKPIPQATLLTRSIQKFREKFPLVDELPWVSFHEGDICCKETLPQKEEFDWILHAATESTYGPKLEPLIRFDQIVSGTKNILEMAVRCGAQRFLLTSSGGVYGPQPITMPKIAEDWVGMPDPLIPDNAYSVGKRMAEHLVALYAKQYGISFNIARCFTFVGRDLPLDVHFAVGNFIRDALHGKKIVIKGSGSEIRSYLDQRDLAEWIISILEYGKTGEAYNVGSDKAISIKDLAIEIRDLIAPNAKIEILGEPANGARNIYVPDTYKIHKEIGVKCKYSLRESISDMALHAKIL